MDIKFSQEDEERAAKRMHKRRRTVFKTAFEAHERAKKSQSEIAKYNSGLLQKLEKQFAANPEFDLASKIPSTYGVTREKLDTAQKEKEKARAIDKAAQGKTLATMLNLSAQ